MCAAHYCIIKILIEIKLEKRFRINLAETKRQKL